MFSGLRRFLPAVLLLPLIFAAACRGQEKFSFDFLSDTHTSPAGAPVEGFAATCEHLLQAGPGDFLILGGDYDNFGRTREVIERILVKPLAEKGRKYPFYVAVGNHDVVNASNDKKDDDGTGLQTQAIIAHGRQLP
ncbi:MAG TPA: metallophosphoesterase, partial [Phycisphaerae bacterium]|nr:metallophosphoesterase [Phycisphaerae bacterium]